MTREEARVVFKSLAKDIEQAKGSICCPFGFKANCKETCGKLFPELSDETVCPCYAKLQRQDTYQAKPYEQQVQKRKAYVRKRFWDFYYRAKREASFSAGRGGTE